MLPLILLLLHSVSCLKFPLGIILEDAGLDVKMSWPFYANETLVSVLNDIKNVFDYVIDLTYIYAECDTKLGLIQSTRSLTDNRVKGFIGPGCSEVCKNTAYIADKDGFNVPMISYACTLDSLSEKDQYSTFARTVSSVGANAVPMIAIIREMKWERVGIIYRNIGLYEEAAASLKKSLEESFAGSDDFPDGFRVVCYKVWYFDDDEVDERMNTAKDIRNECKYQVRVFIILAYDSDVIPFLQYAYEDESFPFKKSAFITLEVTQTSVTDNTKEYTRGLLTLSPKDPSSDPDNQMFQKLTKDVRSLAGDNSIVLDVNSANLYDSLWTYAHAAKHILSTGRTLDDVYNGTLMAKVISELDPFEGASGSVHFDKNSDRVASINVFQAQMSGDAIKLAPIFATNQTDNTLIKIADSVYEWNDGSDKPPPACGEGRELCTEPDLQKTILLVVLPIGVLLLVIAAVILIFLMWRSKVQRLQDRCLWKIRSSDVEFKDAAAQSGRSMSRMSAMSDASLNHGIVAYYKNNPVYLKYLNTEIKQFNVTDDVILEFKQVRELTHQNLNPYIGACVEVPDNFFLASLYCRKGSLQDVLSDTNLKLDSMFQMSFIFDICKGMQAIHNSPIKYHGRLKSCNCVIDAHWVLKITDYGLRGFLGENALVDPMKSEDGKYFDLLWTAPEVLKQQETLGSQKGDMYSFAIIVTEIMSKNTPYGDVNCSAKEIVDKVMSSYSPPFRPDMPLECSDGLAELINMCWDENPTIRPDFPKTLTYLQVLHPQKQRSITDRMIKMMEQYTDNLEELVAERSEQLALEKEKADNLLCRMLPKPIAEKLKQGEPVAPQAFDEVTIYFSDIVGFTDLSSQSTPFQVVDLLNDLYTLFDGIVERHDVYKVETIGDAYMVVSGLPTRNGPRHVAEISNMSLDLLDSVKKFKVRHKPDIRLKLRIGMHTGSVCAGVVGHKMPRYCLFGDTVNTASRMESNGEPLKIHLSGSCREALEKIGGYSLECRGEIPIKGKGKMVTWWLQGKEVSLEETQLTSSLMSANKQVQISDITTTSASSQNKDNSRKSSIRQSAKQRSLRKHKTKQHPNSDIVIPIDNSRVFSNNAVSEVSNNKSDKCETTIPNQNGHNGFLPSVNA